MLFNLENNDFWRVAKINSTKLIVAQYSNVTNKIRSLIVMRFHFMVASGSLIAVKIKTDRRFSNHVFELFRVK